MIIQNILQINTKGLYITGFCDKMSKTLVIVEFAFGSVILCVQKASK